MQLPCVCVSCVSSLSGESVESIKEDVVRIDACASLCPQREQGLNSDSRSPPSPEDTPVVFVDRYLEKHITPVTLKSNIKRNPLYMDIRLMDTEDKEKSKPSWTVKEYDTQTVHGNLAHYLKVMCGEEETLIDRKDGWLRDGLVQRQERQTAGQMKGIDDWINSESSVELAPLMMCLVLINSLIQSELA